MLNQVVIKLSSEDHRILDEAVGVLVTSVPENECDGFEISISPSEDNAVTGRRVLNRKVVFDNPSDKFVGVLAKIDLPSGVNVSIQNLVNKRS